MSWRVKIHMQLKKNQCNHKNASSGVHYGLEESLAFYSYDNEASKAVTIIGVAI